MRAAPDRRPTTPVSRTPLRRVALSSATRDRTAADRRVVGRAAARARCFDGAPRGDGSELARMAAPDAGSDKGCRDAQLDVPCERTPPHTTHLRDFPRPVTILRERHPFEGRVLQALGATHRRGVALLLV